MIQVRRAAESDSFVFEVVVREGNGETHHHVTMSEEMCERLTSGGQTPNVRDFARGLPVIYAKQDPLPTFRSGTSANCVT